MEGWRKNGTDDGVLGGGAGMGRAEARTDDPMKTLSEEYVLCPLSSGLILSCVPVSHRRAKPSILNPA